MKTPSVVDALGIRACGSLSVSERASLVCPAIWGGLLPRRRRLCWFVLLVVLLVANAGCLTSALWEKANPNKRLRIPSSKTTEEELEKKGIAYEKIQLTKEKQEEMGVTSPKETVEVYLVEKSRMRKLCDTAVLVVATPFTVVADGALICGACVAWLWAHDDSRRSPNPDY